MKMNKRKAFIAVLSCFAVGTAGAALAGCTNTVGYIDAPKTTLEEELGVYVIPEYDVVDKNGMVLYGYDVTLKSVKDSDGNSVDVLAGSVTVEEAGIYKFVYTANQKGVSDVTVKIDFADRTAPTVNFDASALPDFFITGNSYRIPQYTLAGDYDRSKCWTKVVYKAEDGKESDVAISSNRFTVDEKSGTYSIRIHVEDAAGNVNDYEYTRKVDGPETIRENVVAYLDEEFGERQVYCFEDTYKGEYVSKDTAGAKVHEDANGSYKVTFSGAETRNNEGYLVIKTPAILDVSNCIELEMWVYNDTEKDCIMGSTWWNDTAVKKGEWTRITWSIANWGNNTQVDNTTKVISPNDISNMGIRFMSDYTGKNPLKGTFYLSAMRAIPKEKSNVTASEDVTLDSSSYSLGDTVRLTAAEKSGQVVNSFKVDGEYIAGNSFVVTDTQHHVEVEYVSELTYDTMKWGTAFHYPVANGNWMTSNHMTTEFIGSSEQWVVSADVVGGFNSSAGGQLFNLTFMVGDVESVEIQLYESSGVIKWYFGGGNDWNTPIATLSDAAFNKLKNASASAPVNVTVIRSGDLLLFMIDGEYAGQFKIKNAMTNNAFGIGYRKEGADKPVASIVNNVKAVIGEERVELCYARLGATVTAETGDVSTDKTSYRLGDTVTLTAAEKEDGTIFGYFTVDGVKITGNSFTVTKRTHTVGVVYVEMSTITFEDGVSAAEGNEVGRGYNLTLTHGAPPEDGKVFDYYLVDNEIKVYGNVFTTTAATHTIKAVWADADAYTWGTDDARYDYETIMGDSSVEWSGRNLQGSVFGSSEYWAIQVDVKHTTEWNAFEFIQGSKQSIRIRFHQGNYFGVILMVNGGETTPTGDFVNAYPNQNAAVVSKLLKGATVTCVRNGGMITMYVDNVPFFRTTYEVDHTGDWFGIGHIPNSDANSISPELTNVKFIMGQEKVEAYLETFKTTLTKVDVTTDKDAYYLGDTVELTAAVAPAGKKFLHFAVDGEPISGNSFVVTKNAHTVAAVYADISNVTLAEGIQTIDGGKLSLELVKGKEITLVYLGFCEDGKYCVGFKVDGVDLDGNTFTPTADTHEITAVFADRVQTGNDALTDVSVAANADKIVSTKWNPISAEYVTDVHYNGADGAIDTSGVLKVVASSNDNSLALDSALVDNLDNYKAIYFYAYTAASGVELGGWWCNDTKLTAGEWTKVIFTREFAPQNSSEKSVWTEGINKFIYRVKGAASGDVIYVTAIYGVPYAEVNVTKDTATAEYLGVSLPADGESYKEGETVTLTNTGKPVGKEFKCFTVNGEEIEGNTYKLTDEAVVFGVKFTDISELDLEAGIVTADEKTEYGRGVKVTLEYNGTPEAGKLFNCFKVDGVAIAGNTFVTSNATHAVTADFVSSASEMTFAEISELKTHAYNWSAYKFNGKSVGEADHWVMNIPCVTGTVDGWKEFDILVADNASIQVRMHPNLAVGGVQFHAMGTNFGDGRQLAAYQSGNGGGDKAQAIIDTFSASTQISPVQVTAIRDGNKYYILVNGELVFNTEHDFGGTANTFGAGATCGLEGTGAAWLQATEVTPSTYMSGAERVNSYLTVKTTGTRVTFDNTDGVYKLGDTVTFTADAEGDNEGFTHVLLDGKRIEGNTFTASKHSHTVEAVYGEVSNVTLNGVKTRSGKTKFAIGETVYLLLDSEPETGKFFDCFTLDGVPLAGNTFTVTESAHTASVRFASSADDMTWTSVNYTAPQGTDQKKAVIGEATDWVLSYKVYGLQIGDDLSIADEAHNQYIGAYVGNVANGSDQLVGYELSIYGKKLAVYGGNWAQTKIDLTDEIVTKLKDADEANPLTMIYARLGNTLKAYMYDGTTYYTIGEFDLAALGVTDNHFGLGARNGFIEPTVTGIEYVTGAEKVEAYLASITDGQN